MRINLLLPTPNIDHFQTLHSVKISQILKREDKSNRKKNQENKGVTIFLLLRDVNMYYLPVQLMYSQRNFESEASLQKCLPVSTYHPFLEKY